MEKIGSENLISYVVNTHAPLVVIPRNGIDSVTGGLWLSDPDHYDKRWSDPEFFSYSPQKMKAWEMLIKDVSTDPECPEFGASMSSREYKIFVSKYFDRLKELCEDDKVGRDHRFYFKRKNIENSEDEYLVPDCDCGFQLLMNKSERENYRRKATSVLKSMCEDPYQFNRASINGDIDQCKFERKDAELYFARMGIFMHGQDLEGVSPSGRLQALSDRFIGSGVIFREIRDKALVFGMPCKLISPFDFEGLFVAPSPLVPESGLMLSNFLVDTFNNKDWKMPAWDGARQSYYQKLAYDSLVNLWRMNSDIPTASSLQMYWRTLAKDSSNSFGVSVDPETRVISFPGKKAGMLELESNDKTSGYIKKFVLTKE